MLPHSLGTTKIISTAVTKAPTTATESVLCIRCSRSTFTAGNNPVATCAKGHIQCRDCDKVMRHQCKRCGFLTTVPLKQLDTRSKSIDPRAMSPEELTQLELNAALNQFKINFLKKSKKKQLRLIDATCRIIEILNPNFIILYKQSGRMKRKKIEDHFFRTSEKCEHTFAWHKAALEFVMDRLINLDFYSTFYDIDQELEFRYKKSIDVLENVESYDFFEKQSQYRTEGKRLKKHKHHISYKEAESFNQQLIESFDKKHFMPELMRDTQLIFVKPIKWLTEISCPHCRLDLRLSDFSKHFATYHCLPIECMDVDEIKQISLDPKVLLNRSSYPHTLFLVKNVVRDLGGSDYRNFYPIVLITAAMCTADSNENNKKKKYERKHLMLWLSGIYFNDQIEVCLKVVSRHLKDIKQCLILDTVYPVTGSQHLSDIHESGAMLILTPETLKVITKNNIENITLEISIHIKNTSSV